MPVIDARIVGPDEYDLPTVSVPALAAGAAHTLADLRATGLVYIGCLVTNASGDTVTLRDSGGNAFPVQSGQPADCDLDPGVTSIWVIPDAATLADEVILIPRVRVLRGR